MISPAKTSDTWKFDEAVIITFPIPRLEATVSDSTAPTKDSVIATFSAAKPPFRPPVARLPSPPDLNVE